MKKNKKPVVLITGYLGSGKTTLLICAFGFCDASSREPVARFL